MNRRSAIKRASIIGGATFFSFTSISALLQSCQSEDRHTWQPKLLSKEQAELVSALVDMILPKTDTPGGLDVKVDMFIDLFFTKALEKEQQDASLAEMDAFNDKCVEKYGDMFQHLDSVQKTAILSEAEASSPKFGRGIWGYGVGEQPPVGFYRSFKSMAIFAYCTSEEIGRDHLNYDPVPGVYQGCIPFEEVKIVWSL
ncbi:MAG: gluconate 2-dehydrogenase subunit 3 family protein [Saprospiraceae bacterium]|nr:gluconate 2-dehydrogenase subunit 3 family protein [Saprospiraceae bacterium]